MIPADLAIVSIGLKPSTAGFAAELACQKNGRLEVNEQTLETSVSGIFAGGDAVTGPSMIVQAIGQGHRAAFYINHYLQGNDLASQVFNDRLPSVNKEEVLHGSRALPCVPGPRCMRWRPPNGCAESSKSNKASQRNKLAPRPRVASIAEFAPNAVPACAPARLRPSISASAIAR